MDRREEERRRRQEQERRERDQRRREEQERTRKQRDEQQRLKRQELDTQRKLQRKLAKQQREKRRREAAAAKQPGEKGPVTRFVLGALKTITGRFQSPQAAQRKDEERKKVQSIFRVIGGSSGSRKLTPEEEATFARMKANAEERKTERQAAAQRRIEGYGIELGKGPRPGVAGDDEGARS